jgi:hypothetical protein
MTPEQTETLERPDTVNLDRKVFEEAEFPIGYPHIMGMSKIMHEYVDPLDTNEGGSRFSGAVDEWARKAASTVGSINQAKYVYDALTTRQGRLAIHNHIGLDPQSADERERFLYLVGIDIASSYEISKFAATYVDTTYGNSQKRGITVAVSPTVIPEAYIEAKMSAPLPGSRKRVSLLNCMAASNRFEKSTTSALDRLGNVYEQDGTVYDPERTKKAMADITFLRSKNLNEQQKRIVREHRTAALRCVVEQDFDGFDTLMESLMLEVPTAIGYVRQTELGLTSGDVNDLDVYALEEQKVEKAAKREESFKGALGAEATKRQIRETLDSTAEQWLLDQIESVQGSVWQVEPLTPEGDRRLMTIKSVHLNGYRQVAAWFNDAAATEDGNYYCAPTDTKGHIKALSLKTLIDMGLVRRIPDARVSDPKDDKTATSLEDLSFAPSPIRLYSEAVANLIRRNPEKPLDREIVIASATSLLNRHAGRTPQRSTIN